MLMLSRVYEWKFRCMWRRRKIESMKALPEKHVLNLSRRASSAATSWRLHDLDPDSGRYRSGSECAPYDTRPNSVHGDGRASDPLVDRIEAMAGRGRGLKHLVSGGLSTSARAAAGDLGNSPASIAEIPQL